MVTILQSRIGSWIERPGLARRESRVFSPRHKLTPQLPLIVGPPCLLSGLRVVWTRNLVEMRCRCVLDPSISSISSRSSNSWLCYGADFLFDPSLSSNLVRLSSRIKFVPPFTFESGSSINRGFIGELISFAHVNE